MGSYRPRKKNVMILKRAIGYVDSVPYRVTARWLFYRLLQDGTYRKKGDYKNRFLDAITEARKSFYDGWAPDTLADDTRVTLWRGGGYATGRDWVTALSRGLECNLDYWIEQRNYVEIWFEAGAMRSQFEYYTEHVTLRPFKGDPSVDFKWRIAQHLTEVTGKYPDKPIIILYFGDYDPKGLQIPESAVKDIRKWTLADFRFIRCGLNPEHPQYYDIPENFEKPGTYQWEALDDDAAKDLIVTNVEQWVDFELFEEVSRREEIATDQMTEFLVEATKKWDEDYGS